MTNRMCAGWGAGSSESDIGHAINEASRSQPAPSLGYNAGTKRKRPDYGHATPEDLARALMWTTIERRKAARYRRPDRAARAAIWARVSRSRTLCFPANSVM